MLMAGRAAAGLDRIQAVRYGQTLRHALARPCALKVQEIVILAEEVHAGGRAGQQAQRLVAVVLVPRTAADYVHFLKHRVVQHDFKSGQLVL